MGGSTTGMGGILSQGGLGLGGLVSDIGIKKEQHESLKLENELKGKTMDEQVSIMREQIKSLQSGQYRNYIQNQLDSARTETEKQEAVNRALVAKELKQKTKNMAISEKQLLEMLKSQKMQNTLMKREEVMWAADKILDTYIKVSGNQMDQIKTMGSLGGLLK